MKKPQKIIFHLPKSAKPRKSITIIKNHVMIRLVALILLCCCSINAAVPNEITYQGRLKEYGQAITGTRTMCFKIYDAATDGHEKWSSGNTSVTITNGLFSKILSPSLDWRGRDYYIETIISGKILAPREKITAQIYALHSQTAEDITKSEGAIHFCIGESTPVIVQGDGKIGVGTTQPQAKLDVNGDIRADSMFIGGSLVVPVYAGVTPGTSHGELVRQAYNISQGGKAFVTGSYDITDTITAFVRFKIYVVNEINISVTWNHDDAGYIYINSIQAVSHNVGGTDTSSFYLPPGISTIEFRANNIGGNTTRISVDTPWIQQNYPNIKPLWPDF